MCVCARVCVCVCVCVQLHVQNRAIVPGLYESYVPRGITVLDSKSYLISMQPVGERAGEPSLILRMRRKKNGKIMRIYRIYTSSYEPYTGTVRDLAVSGNDDGMPEFVWTGDDTLDECVGGLGGCARSFRSTSG